MSDLTHSKETKLHEAADLNLPPDTKANLHEVADLMLEIYRTLERMRYLDPSWIQVGPHNIDAILPICRSRGLDDSIIYLYSILPYVDASVFGKRDFFQGGRFANFLDEEEVKDGRNPQYDDNELPPYMTPLSMLGNHRSFILYNARNHRVAIVDDESNESADRNLDEEGVALPLGGSEGEGSEDGERSGAEKGASEADDDTREDKNASSDEEIAEKGDSDEEDSDEEEPYVNIGSRPAGSVLRDIVRWYHELVELPGDGDQSGARWDAEVVEPLYRKHGWPHAYFDGDAFLADQARVEVAPGLWDP